MCFVETLIIKFYWCVFSPTNDRKLWQTFSMLQYFYIIFTNTSSSEQFFCIYCAWSYTTKLHPFERLRTVLISDVFHCNIVLTAQWLWHHYSNWNCNASMNRPFKPVQRGNLSNIFVRKIHINLFLHSSKSWNFVFLKNWEPC